MQWVGTVRERQHVVAGALQRAARHALRRVQLRVVHVAVRAPRQVHACAHAPSHTIASVLRAQDK